MTERENSDPLFIVATVRDDGDFGVAGVPCCLREPVVEVAFLDTLALKMEVAKIGAYNIRAVFSTTELLAPARIKAVVAKDTSQFAFAGRTLLA